MTLKLMLVVGARPNFPKVAPILEAVRAWPDRFKSVLVHTGQHYDYNMSQVFFEQLEMPTPDEFLNVGSGTHAAQTATVMTAFEPVLVKHRPDWVLVVGDVNSTLACALVCAKMGVRVAHVEAGLRSRDRTMPEEINRLVTDQISDLLFTPSRDANENLVHEGIEPAKIHFVGNVMIDTLVKLLPKARERTIRTELNCDAGQYVLVTLHRPSNVEDSEVLGKILKELGTIAKTRNIVFPVHPRTRKRIQELGIQIPQSVRLIEPLGYLDFLSLMSTAGLVITDSGGVQEETSFLGISCLTLRENTERPITIQEGTNRLVRRGHDDLVQAVEDSFRGKPCAAPTIEFWDGRAAERIVQVMMDI